MLAHVRDVLLVPLEARLEALELGRRRLEHSVEENLTARAAYDAQQRWPPVQHDWWRQREGHMRESLREQLVEELRPLVSRKGPSVEQVEALHETLSTQIQRLPVVVTYPHGRWTWTRGKLRSAVAKSAPPLLPWNAERLNTSPGTFGWVTDRAFIEVLAAGLYVITAAVFVPGGPTIGVTVNGQTVLRRLSSTRQVVDASGLIAGSSIRDVLSLAPGARVAVQCEVNPGAPDAPMRMQDAHGLLELKKLW